MRSPANAVRGGITVRPSSPGRPASGGMAWSAYMAGYKRRNMASVGADIISKMDMMRSSTGTSRGCPRSAVHLPAHNEKSGTRRMRSGKMRRLNARAADVFSSRNSLSATIIFSCTASRASCRRAVSARSTPSRVRNAAMAPPSTALYISATSLTTGTAIVCTLMRRSPSAVVYSSAHCKNDCVVVGSTSSCAICTAYAVSALVAGSASRSMERIKKWPLNEDTRKPLLQRTRHTASHAVNRVRLWCSSRRSRGASRASRNPG
mmetsp:Transcript_18053/g.44732  ORF Transcript_18053/g.44732 Transcript_18053/m.44732 type:complete len:263 (-) Transcript_18053:1269-2057(-)